MNQFIRHADFILKPFEKYLIDFIYVWKPHISTPNPDGIVRLPFRSQFIISNWFFGPQFTAYFYILFVLVFSFFSFFILLKKVTKTSYSTKLVASTFFTFNPIFLGNFSKIGLQFGVACLAVILVFLIEYRKDQRLKWLIGCVILLIGSFVHPFTLMVNIITAAGFLVINFRKFKLAHIAISALVTLLLSMYFILPIYNIGSVSRAQLETTAKSKTDFTDLIEIANTRGLVEGLTLHKSVFVDYEFYNEAYYPVYLISIFIFFFIVLYLIVNREKNTRNSKLTIGLLLLTLILIALSDVSNDLIANTMAFVIKTPFGWAFRSPLKWQLYIPFVVAFLTAVSMQKIQRQQAQKIGAAIFVCIIGMNGYLIGEIYTKLLVPKTISSFSTFSREELKDKRALYISNFECLESLIEEGGLNSELDYILQTSGLQVTRTAQDDVANYSLNDFHYILDCSNYPFDNAEQEKWSEVEVNSPNDTIKIHKTLLGSTASAYTTNTAWQQNKFDVTKLQNTAESLENDRLILTRGESGYNGKIKEILNSVRKDNFVTNFINLNIDIDSNYENVQLFSGSKVDNERIIINGDKIDLLGDEVTTSDKEASARDIPARASYDITYSGKGFGFENLVPNPSFENGLWQNKVGDCFNYDKYPDISMSHSSDSYDGPQSLSLEAKRHIACTKSSDFNVREDGHIFVSFKANLKKGERFQYAITFNNPGRTTLERTIFPLDQNEWQEYTDFLTVPKNADAVTIFLYSIPEVQGLEESVILFDDFFVTDIPDIANKLYIVATDSMQQENTVSEATRINPVSYSVKIENPAAIDSTYLVLREKFHKGWKIKSINGSAASKDIVSDHFAESNGYNVWRINNLSKHGQDLDLVIEFEPQKWFYVGSVISGTTFVGVLGYLGWDWRRSRRKRAARSRNKEVRSKGGSHDAPQRNRSKESGSKRAAESGKAAASSISSPQSLNTIRNRKTHHTPRKPQKKRTSRKIQL